MTQRTHRYTSGAVLLVALTLFGVAVASAAAGAAGVTDNAVSSDDSSVVALNESVPNDTVLGDVNQDGAVESNDALLIGQEAVGIRGGGSFFAPAGDINRDGEIRSNDALLAGQKAVGILDEADVVVSNLSAPGTVTAGGTLTLSAELENLGEEGALQNITVRAAPDGTPLDGNATLDEQFVDMAVAGVDTPVSRPAQTTVTFENVTVDVDPGNYTLGVFSENDNVTAPLTIEANSEVTGTVTASGNTASTTQTPGAGEPVPNATVTLYDGDSTDPADVINSTAVDQAGNYLFEGVSPGNYTVEADAVDFSAGSALISVGTNETVQQDLALDYGQGGSVSGQLSLGTVDPGEDVPVTVEVVETGDSTQVTLTGDNDTASYTLSGIDVNVDDGYTVTASEATGNYLAPADATNVTVDVNATTGGVDFGFDRRTGGLNGTVTNANTGSGVANATVEVSAFGPGGPVVANDTTDADGEYTVPGLPVGSHQVTVLVDGTVVGDASATVLDNQTVTQDFAFNGSSLQVSILDSGVAGVAGAAQTLDANLTNTGELPANQTVTLDWGNGTYTSTADVVVAGGSSVTETLSITTDADQAIGFYTAEVASEDDTDTVEATLAPERSINASEVPAGGTVEVTVSGQIGSLSTVDLADEWSPDADGAAQPVSSTFAPDQEILGSGAVAVVFDENSGNFEYVYQFDVSPDATAGSVYEWQPLQGGDGSALQVDGTPFPILGDESFEIAETVDDIVLDSVSSLLNASGQPLRDDSITAVEAEPSATNTDADGNGDAVSYPSDVDIPVVAVDDNVVGVTGPFVATDTDFANFGNEEVMLNLYDQLLGGSGTIVHDEGHGQFYTLAPNGGDDFQAFAGYAENNGYTYTNTTDIQNATSTADAFVITSPSDAFTQNELDALSTFVDNGGVVFLHDQSDFSNFDATDNHNAIASAVNASFRFNDDQVVDDQNNTGARFVPTTGNFDTERFTPLFSDREGLGLELNVSESYEVDVVDVTDGDTADVQFNNSEGTVDTVRIVGIDTPETGNTEERLEEYEGIDDGPALKIKGDDATAYAQSQLSGKTVTLSFDENEGLRGNFGRLLGFLELPDGSVYNEEVIRDGFARVYDSGFAGHDEYWDLEDEARANDRGIWNISDPAATPEVGDGPVEELFFPEPVEVTGPETPVSSENGTPLVALDTGANVAAIGGPLIEESFETGEGGPGIDQYDVYPFLTNVIANLSDATGPVVVDGGHGQFGADYAVSAEDTAYYMRYLEGQSTANEQFIGLEGAVDLASGPGPDLLQSGSPAARAVIISTPTTELSAAERTAVTDFADAGGAVILLGSAANTSSLANFDPLLSELNTSVGFTTTAVTDGNNNLAGDPVVPTTTNFDEANFPDLFTAFTPPAEVTVSSLSPQTATVNESEAFDVSATVENVDSIPADQQIELRLEPDGSAVATEQVQLASGANTTVTFQNVSVDQGGRYNHTVASPTDRATGSLTVESVFADVFLDSVSSLLNASGQPLTDDSITAIEAEPTATNTDADGDGDAVSYPSDVDIPVVAVDDNVVGVTGPFVASNTDFGSYGNEEFLLNLYDRLLGGSGTIVHDEGHGQFYTLAPNGGDDFQAFAGYAENNGYTYTNTTDIQNATSTADAFVITTPSEAFTQSELDALSTFVDNGGVVFLHDQSDFNNFDATDNHNAIASAVNASFRFNDDQVVDSTNNGGASFLPVTGNFNEADFPQLFEDRSDTGLSSAVVTELGAYDAIVATSG
jgi:endonuclease YncB( thermonuclease family)